jgi:hypothetical protein
LPPKESSSLSDFDKYNPYSYRALEARVKAGENIPADDLVGALKFNVPANAQMPVLVLEHICLRLAGEFKPNGRPTRSFKEKSRTAVEEQLAVDYYYRVLDILERELKSKTDSKEVSDKTPATRAAEATLALFFKGKRNMGVASFQNNLLPKYPDKRKRS